MRLEEAKQNIGKLIYGFYGGTGKLVAVKSPGRFGRFQILVQKDWGGQMWESADIWSFISFDPIILGPSDTNWQDGF